MHPSRSRKEVAQAFATAKGISIDLSGPYVTGCWLLQLSVNTDLACLVCCVHDVRTVVLVQVVVKITRISKWSLQHMLLEDNRTARHASHPRGR